MLQDDNIKTILFIILCACFAFYLFMGISSYNRDKRSKLNVIFFVLCIAGSIFAIGYAFMLISTNIQIANRWRIFANCGAYFFTGLWVSFAFLLNDTAQKKSSLKIQFLIYISLAILFISNAASEPSRIISHEYYGFVDNLYFNTTIGSISSVYLSSLYIVGFVIIFLHMRNTKKNRVKKQMKVILITCVISFCIGTISNLIFPKFGVVAFPFGVIIISFAMCGMWYAINKYKMMSISYKLVSEYIFEAVNEPIFILGEDFSVINSNEASLNISGYNRKDLKENPFETIINFRDFEFKTIMQIRSVINIEVDLYRKGKAKLVCELSATVIYDEYEDILGIIVLLHDVSERKSLAEIQNIYTLKLEESNILLKNENKDRQLAEEQIRHLIYYDALTQTFNRKKMLEDVDLLVDNKNEKFAILFVDLDKFKYTNDNYGHEAGDYILKTVAERLKDSIRSVDTLYRIGGDEFIIILRNIEVAENAEKIANDVLKTLNTVFTYKGNQLFIGGSIGISIFPEHGFDSDMLIRKADLDMYEVKRRGGNDYKVYSRELDGGD